MKTSISKWLKLFTDYILFMCLGLLLLISCQGHSQKSERNKVVFNEKTIEGLKDTIDLVIEKEMKENHIPGFALVLVKEGKTIYKKGYGVANMQTGRKVDPDTTIFRIGSISKALTLLALTKLIDEDKIGLNDDVSRYFTGIQNPNNFKEPIEIQHLLTHTSGFDQIGISRHIYDFELPLHERKTMRAGISDFLKSNNLRRITPAGEYYRYDTYGTTLAGAIIEKITKLPFPEAMKKVLFEPAGMNNSFVEVTPAYMENLALGHGYTNGQYQIMPYEVYKTLPASSIDATPADMGRLLEVLTNDGLNEKGRFYTREMANNILNPQYRPHPDFIGTSHGLHESARIGVPPEAYDIRTIGHGGDMLGTSSIMTIIPSMKLGIFATANRNSEAGGPPVRLFRLIMNTIVKYLGLEKVGSPYEIPKQKIEVNLEEYRGNYYFGVFCHSCTEEEYAQGAWRRSSNPLIASISNDTLLLNSDKYIPKTKDIFVRSDGNEMVYFGRDKEGKITFLNFSDGNSPLERIDD